MVVGGQPPSAWAWNLAPDCGGGHYGIGLCETSPTRLVLGSAWRWPSVRASHALQAGSLQEGLPEVATQVAEKAAGGR